MIPRVIHFIWLMSGDDKFCAPFTYSLRSAILNTTMKVVLHTDDPSISMEGVEVRLITRPNVEYAHLAHLRDIIRCKILFEEGGIYSDTDVIWLRNPWELMDKHVVSCFTNQPYRILCNAVMMSEKGADEMKQYMDWIISISPCKKYYIPANPYKLWIENPNVVMLPRHYFFPLTYTKTVNTGTIKHIEKSICVHLFGSLADVETNYRRIFGSLLD